MPEKLLEVQAPTAALTTALVLVHRYKVDTTELVDYIEAVDADDKFFTGGFLAVVSAVCIVTSCVFVPGISL